MRRVLALVFILTGTGLLLLNSSLQPTAASNHHASLMEIDGVIDPFSSDFLARGIENAEDNGSQFLIVQLDTPGGLLESTREMVEHIIASPLPVVVYVSPSGAQAASAGTFITASAHIAAMAPTTNIGAASPVGSGGDELPETIKSKIMQDTAAFMRSIAEERNRNADALQSTVLRAESFTATEALDKGIVDIVARDMNDLLAQLDGFKVSLSNSQIVLDTDGLTISSIDQTAVEKFLEFIANPNFAFLLLTIGGIGILIEFLSPGLMGPGAIGVIALAIAFLALGNLPVNWVGVGLIILAMALFYMEAQAPGIGVFGVGGVISFILGAFLLFGNLSFRPEVPSLPGAPSVKVSLWLIGAVSVLMFASLLMTFRAMRQAKSIAYHPSATDPSNLVGEIGMTTSTLNPRGTVQVAGEMWSAESDSGQLIEDNEEIVVLEASGLILKVFKPDMDMD